VVRYRWRWAPGLEPAWREAILAAFESGAVAAGLGPAHRNVPGRRYGAMERLPPLPFGVFIKAFERPGVSDRLRRLWGGVGPSREFANAVRLYGMGLPVPRPLAYAEADDGVYHLMEHVAGGRPLGQVASRRAAPDDFGPLADAVGRLLVMLAQRGICHRDLNAENLLVTSPAGADPSGAAVRLIDVRHVAFGRRPASALGRMLEALAAFLLAAGADESHVRRIAEATTREAGRAAEPIRLPPPADVLDRGRLAARDLIARQVRKGKRPVADLDYFADRYASAGAAADYHDRRFGRSRHGRKVDAAERRIVARLVGDLGIGGPVLDVPCGAGRFLPIFLDAGARVVGADVSEEMLALACRAAGGPACLAADARRLPFSDGVFDLVFSMRLLHRVRDGAQRIEVLCELARVGRRHVLFSFYDRRSWRGLRDRLRGRYPGQTRAAIAAEVQRAGLRLERFIPVIPWGRQTLVLCRIAGAVPRAGLFHP